MAERKVHQVYPSVELGEPSLRFFSHCLSHRNLILLGDPGSGKSHLLRHFAAWTGARYLTARDFLNLPPPQAGASLFIDGLDEKRAGRGDQDTIDRMVQKLFATIPAQVRIACRAQDWLGDSDLAAFRAYFERHGGITVFALQPLSENEQLAVLAGGECVDAEAFLEKARRKGLHEFLGNPQNLIMLSKVVASGRWPETRNALYREATRLLLAEPNPEKRHFGGGVFDGGELREAAGAICAARLISDVEGVSLAAFSPNPDFPSYRTITGCDTAKALAALTRRCFVATATPETVTYAHRTVAEYLAADWLASRIRHGLPLRRLESLLGIDGRPAAGLRGLNAWLAVTLPEQARAFIDADPYGVLTYGDAASLAPSARPQLLRALELLSRKDPWFRSGNWSSPQVGALSGADMVEAFRGILASPDANFGIRSVVVDAIAMGPPLPELEEDLVAVVTRRQSTFAERIAAVEALFRLGDSGRSRLAAVLRSGLGSGSDGLRLRAEILNQLYGEGFEPADVLSLLVDLLDCEENLPFGLLRDLASRMPVADVCALLDGFERKSPNAPVRTERHNLWEISGFLDQALLRVLRSEAAVPGTQLWKWLRDRGASRDFYSGSVDDLKNELQRRRDLHPALMDAALEKGDSRGNYLLISRFREATLNAVDEDEFIEAVERHFLAAKPGAEKHILLYQLGMNLSYRCTERSVAVFDRLFASADQQPHLVPVREQATVCCYEEWQREDARQRQWQKKRKAIRLAKRCRDFARAEGKILAGEERNWLGYLGEAYFSEHDASPRQALESVIGKVNAQIALQGFSAFLARQEPSGLEELLKAIEGGQYYRWWYAIIAGMDEAWRAEQNLSSVTDNLLQIALAIDLELPTAYRESGASENSERPWKRAALAERPYLAAAVYLRIARIRMAHNADHVDGLHLLLHEPALRPLRAAIVVELLSAFPNVPRPSIRSLLESGVTLSQARDPVLHLARSVRDCVISVAPDCYDLWIAAGYIIAPEEFGHPLSACLVNSPEVIWDLRDLTRFDHGNPGKDAPPLSPAQLRELALIVGRHFPNCRRPPNGWSGTRDAWDGSDFVHGLVNQLSASPAAEATQALRRLAEDDALESYRENLHHALANQDERRREFLYQQPTWDETLKTLSNGPPASAADLQAVILDHLADIAGEIANSNTDIFKRFWNETPYRKIDKPKPEESCRNELVDLLRSRLNPLGLHVEPEGHMARDKRADIAVFGHGVKIVIELKRDYHTEIWSAAELQLDRFYTRDPQSQGYGIYGIFWFGATRPSPMRLPPSGSRPSSAGEMAQQVTETILPGKRHRISVIVLDVSGS